MKTSLFKGYFVIAVGLGLGASMAVAQGVPSGLAVNASPAMISGGSHSSHLNAPYPDPESPKSPFFRLNAPYPDPESPKSPFFRLNAPYPDPESPKSPF